MLRPAATKQGTDPWRPATGMRASEKGSLNSGDHGASPPQHQLHPLADEGGVERLGEDLVRPLGVGELDRALRGEPHDRDQIAHAVGAIPLEDLTSALQMRARIGLVELVGV